MRSRATWTAVAGFLAGLAFVVLKSLSANGQLVYPLDDTYIHLTMARNLADHGTYGIAASYASASSSPAWVLLLAGIFKINSAWALWYPLIINAILGVLIVVLLVCSTPIAALNIERVANLLLLLLIPTALGVTTVASTGMEHLLQTIICLLIFLLLDRLRDSNDRPLLICLAALWLIAVAVRYENLFLAAAVCIVFLLRPANDLHARLTNPGLWISAILPAISAVILGLINFAHGEYFFSNSVVAKSGASQLGALWPHPDRFAANLSADPVLLALLILGLFYLLRFGARAPTSLLWAIFVITALLHTTYATVGQLDRYQTYLVVVGAFVFLRSFAEIRAALLTTPLRVAVVIGVLIILPLGKYVTFAGLPTQARSEYAQQIQQARILSAYNGQGVVVNDIGAVGWLHSGPLLDIWGLGSNQVLRLAAASQYDGNHIEMLAQKMHARVAAVYEILLPLLPDWRPVARLSTPYMPDSQHAVIFLVPDDASEGELVAAIQAARPGFPADTRIDWLVSYNATVNA